MAGHSQLRVLHLLKTSVGGIWALRHMRRVARMGVEVHAALPAGGPLIPDYESAGIRLHFLQPDLPLSRPWLIPAALSRLRALVHEVQPDIIHSHFVGTTLAARRALGRRHPTPRIFQVPGPLHLEHALYRAAEIGSAGPGDYWMVGCEWLRRCYLSAGVPAERVLSCRYGLELERYNHRRTGKLRRELGIDERVKLVGMVAYFYRPKPYLGQTRGLKGHEDLIDAVHSCLEAEPGLLCVFIGGPAAKAGAYERQVRAYARRRCGDRAVFLGERHDVPEIYPDLDVAVHPSHSENIGGAPESLLLGVPTITTNVGGFPDVIIPGETGWLVPPRNPRVLSEAVLDALRHPERGRAMAAQGAALVRTHFDVEQTSRQWVDIYHRVLGQEAPGGSPLVPLGKG